MLNITVFQEGQPFTDFPPGTSGAILEMCKDSPNTLYVMAPFLKTCEKNGFNFGPVSAGVRADEDSLCLVWEFKDTEGKVFFQTDTSFDVRLIPKAYRKIPKQKNSKERALFTLVVVDTFYQRIGATRVFTIAPETYGELCDAIQSQNNNHKQTGMALYTNRWQLRPVQEAIEASNMRLCGQN